ncbi:translation elongation factor Ts [Bacteroides nordii]|jgi:elongation factor Ts|uniref:Elongation factor Ts n=1 Tax=Bacteroides nordii CL02T12C05 TaxID=997884 RepID=I9GDI4_9BACE|nr:MULTISPECIES: translation elongation factor Ts [Bacteroides]OKZ08935.1 MAG: translation elongation factor Ts [Bacteroides sp. 41_26]EIY44634.1 translation elongation factor Ts [Bacteroides nordii CL02T12C05]EOA53722.1 translation elongation factor Ts [Bacteroides sp. HPS0048]MBD9112330.1 elongation factor Ts [Bacteroides nordii]MCE8465294.1 elongation factor Ts [Bacteroides nordii]
MAVTMADITKLRKMTGAGMMDCKNALTEANGDFDGAMKIIREKGQAVAAKRSDREASEGCVLVKVADGFGAIIALKCETDFVAKNEDFIKLTQNILDAAVANKCKTLEEVQALPMGDVTIAQAVTDRSGITGEKMELDGYMTLEGPAIATYNHQGKNFLCTMVALSKEVDPKVGHEVAMQVAAMNPIAVDEAGVPADVLEKEKEIAADKARQEGKPENMIEKIAMGRIGKFYKEVCLLKQEYIQDGKMTVAEYLKSVDKDLTVTAFKRFTLRAE